MTARATALGYGIPTLALAAMCVTMPAELGIIAAGLWRVVTGVVGVLTWRWVG